VWFRWVGCCGENDTDCGSAKSHEIQLAKRQQTARTKEHSGGKRSGAKLPSEKRKLQLPYFYRPSFVAALS
jgi:hypothetical protein